jgi:hypothetical protein
MPGETEHNALSVRPPRIRIPQHCETAPTIQIRGALSRALKLKSDRQIELTNELREVRPRSPLASAECGEVAVGRGAFKADAGPAASRLAQMLARFEPTGRSRTIAKLAGWRYLS